MDQFSFDFGDPIFDMAGWQVRLQVVTFENTYGLDPDMTRFRSDSGRFEITAERLMWAGNQEKAAGSASLIGKLTKDGLELIASACHTKKIRCTKIILGGLPNGVLLGPRWREESVGLQGYILRYPSWQMHSALIFLKITGTHYLYFRSLDDRVRCKRFAIFKERNGLTVELIHEELGPEMGKTTQVPAWRIGRTDNPAAVVQEHAAHVERAFGLEPWETRWDVPDWAREIALVAYIHGQHWTGYIHNTYDDMLRILEWLAERFEGWRVLAHVTGWEGRYYWQYGDYRPDARMGGADGFRRLADGAQRLGVKLQPMFGMNCANAGFENFEQWGRNAYMVSAGGYAYQGNKPDWDTSRAHDCGWQVWLNPGAPAWRNRLLQQVNDLVVAYDLPAVFFDTHHCWQNDPNHPVYKGLVTLRDELKTRFPDLLVAGEGWYDALGAVTPISHSGVPDRWPEYFGDYCRCWAHNSWGDPSRGSTGVFEGGYAPFKLVPFERYWWPTIIFVDGTLEKATDKVELVIEQARKYVKEFLT